MKQQNALFYILGLGVLGALMLLALLAHAESMPFTPLWRITAGSWGEILS